MRARSRWPGFTLRDGHSTLPAVAIDFVAAGRAWKTDAAEVFETWETESGLRDTLV